MRLNRFSKNIIFSENYFLRNFSLAYSAQASSLPSSTYTISEAEMLTRELARESGVLYIDKIGISVAYKPDRELDRFDILSYYYNYLIELHGSHDVLYVLFSPEIKAVIEAKNGKTATDYSRDDVITIIAKLAELSLEWTPFEDKYVGMNVFDFKEVFIRESYEIDVHAYNEYLTKFKNCIITSAERTLDKNTTHDLKYTREEIYLLYYDSVIKNLSNIGDYLPVERVIELLNEYEYGNVRPRILDAENILQLPEYPNGCEAVSAVMLLRYAGYNADKSDFIENHLKKGEMKIRFGIRFGPDPQKMYAGDPSSQKGGWGCFAPAIVDALKSYLSSKEDNTHTALNVSGASLQDLCETFIDCSIPVAIWITEDYSPVKEVYQWLDHDNNQVYLYPKNQHCVMLIGYDKDNYYVCDPLKDEKYTIIPRVTAELSYTSMGSQAVVVIPGNNTQ